MKPIISPWVVLAVTPSDNFLATPIVMKKNGRKLGRVGHREVMVHSKGVEEHFYELQLASFIGVVLNFGK